MLRNLNCNIKNFRTFRKMTQEELANRIGKTKNVVSNWERGDNAPDVDTIEKICKELAVTPNQLFGWEPHKEYEKYVDHINERKLKLMELEEEKQKIQFRIDKLEKEIKEEEYKWKDGD